MRNDYGEDRSGLKVGLLLVGLIFVLAVHAFVSGCGGSSSPVVPSNIPIAIEGLQGETGIQTNSVFTYTFTKPVIGTSVNSGTFYLVSGDSCSEGTHVRAEISMNDPTSPTEITLTPQAALEGGAMYTICLTSAIQYTDGTYFSGASATFTTESALPSVASVTKTSVTSTTEGSMTISYSLGAAAASAPTLSVVSSGGASLPTSCSLSANGLMATCTVNGVAGCTAFTDYTATLGGSVIQHAIRFNSADDEFTSGDSLTNGCWAEWNDGSGFAAEIADGNLVLSAGPDAMIELYKGPAADFAVTIYSSSSVSEDLDDTSLAFYGLAEAAGNRVNLNMFSSGYAAPQDVHVIALGEVVANGVSFTGDLSSYATQVAPWRICQIFYQGTITSYVNYQPLSSSDTAFTRLTADNTSCYDRPGCTTGYFTDYSASGWTGHIGALGYISGASGMNSVDFGFARFRTTGIADSSASCPSLEIR